MTFIHAAVILVMANKIVWGIKMYFTDLSGRRKLFYCALFMESGLKGLMKQR